VESGFVLLALLSAGAGLVLRSYVSARAGRAVLLLGLAALILAIALLGLTLVGRRPLGTWTASLVAVALIGLAALALPFGLTVSVSRRRPPSSLY
jgi:hypothetical protein